MTDLFRDASFFGGCEPKNSDKTDVAENSLVLVSFRISVWTGMSTEQTSVEEGAENMRRRRIVPGLDAESIFRFSGARPKRFARKEESPI